MSEKIVPKRVYFTIFFLLLFFPAGPPRIVPCVQQVLCGPLAAGNT